MSIIEIKKRSETIKTLNINELIKLNFKSSLYENVKITDNIKIFMVIKNVPIEQYDLVFGLIDKFKDYLYIQYQFEINEYIVLYNQHQNVYRIIFQNTLCDLFNNQIYISDFIKSYQNIYEKYIDTEIYKHNSINIICPLQFNLNNKGKYKRKNQNCNYYKIVLYQKRNQLMFYDLKHDYLKKYYPDYKLFELTFNEIHNSLTINKSLIINN